MNFQKPRLTSTSGVAMLELALCLPIILMCLIYLLDGGYLLHKYLRLSSATQIVSRKVAVAVGKLAEDQGNSISCPDLINLATQVINQHKSNTTSFSSAMNWSPSILTFDPSLTPYPIVSIEGTWQVSCFFCTFFENLSILEAHSTLVIEYGFNGC